MPFGCVLAAVAALLIIVSRLTELLAPFLAGIFLLAPVVIVGLLHLVALFILRREAARSSFVSPDRVVAAQAFRCFWQGSLKLRFFFRYALILEARSTARGTNVRVALPADAIFWTILRRGDYRISVKLEISDLLRLFSQRAHATHKTTLVVPREPRTDPRSAKPTKTLPFPSHRRVGEDDFSQKRDYRPGDDARHIDWKTYGLRKKLFVRHSEAGVETAGKALLVVMIPPRELDPDDLGLDALIERMIDEGAAIVESGGECRLAAGLDIYEEFDPREEADRAALCPYRSGDPTLTDLPELTDYTQIFFGMADDPSFIRAQANQSAGRLFFAADLAETGGPL